MSSETADSGDPATVVTRLRQLFDQQGGELYGGEAVTQLQHALQAAQLAQQQDRPPEEIVAALLHDVGHLIHDLGEDCAERSIDDVHELAGARWLADDAGFIQTISEPVRLHVPAKRFLCAVDSLYHAELSAASQLSLTLQGGPFTTDEVAAFRETPYSESAVRLRGWDDLAKQPGLATPSLDHFLELVEPSMLANP
jgi:phosphonate degradation associated HDIG domain protein